MDEKFAAALAAQKELAETRELYARNPRENSMARDARARTIKRLTRIRDELANAAGTTPAALDELLYGSE